MSLSFITFSFRDSKDGYTKRVIKQFVKHYNKTIRMLCKEYGDKERHLHFHSIVEVPGGIIKNKSRLLSLLGCEDQPHGIKIVNLKDVKQEMYYAGYLQKEIKKALPIDIKKDRLYHCVYGDRYLEKAWNLYQEDRSRHKNWSVKHSYDGTELAFTLCSTYEFKGYDQALYCVYQYAREHSIDVKRPESIAHMMLQIKRMDKLRSIPQKRNLIRDYTI